MTTPPHRLLTADEVEKRMYELRAKGDELFLLHRQLMHDCREWLVAMRSMEGIRTYINGAAYGPEEEANGKPDQR